MKTACLLTSIFVFTCRASLALYGPDTDRVPVAVSTVACEQSDFHQGQAIVRALQSQNVSDALAVLPAALSQLRNTPNASSRYAARAFCVHELIPKEIVLGPQPIPSSVVAMRSIGIGYHYYQPDARWLNGPNPVNLVALATDHLHSPWGRQAFLMMTQLGWSLGSCREGPDQFYTVITRGKDFLKRFPRSEISNDVRLAVANAYATWWNLSQHPPGEVTTGTIHDYQTGALKAKQAAIRLYKEYLQAPGSEQSQIDKTGVRGSLSLLTWDPEGSNSLEYFCADYED